MGSLVDPTPGHKRHAASRVPAGDPVVVCARGREGGRGGREGEGLGTLAMARSFIAGGVFALAVLTTPVVSTWVGDAASHSMRVVQRVKAVGDVAVHKARVGRMMAEAKETSDVSDKHSDFDWSDSDWSDIEWSDFSMSDLDAFWLEYYNVTSWSDIDWSDWDWSDWDWSDDGDRSDDWGWGDWDQGSDAEVPDFFYDLTLRCSMGMGNAMSFSYSDMYMSDWSDSDWTKHPPRHPSDWSDWSDWSDHGDYIPKEMELILEECGLSFEKLMAYEGMLFSSNSAICDESGSLDDFGEQCIDLRVVLEGLVCVQMKFAIEIFGPLLDATKDIEGCKESEQALIDDWIQGLVLDAIDEMNPVKALKEDCDGELHPCIAEGGPIDLDALADSFRKTLEDKVEGMVEEASASSKGSDLGTDSDLDGLFGSDSDSGHIAASALAAFSLAAAALLA